MQGMVAGPPGQEVCLCGLVQSHAETSMLPPMQGEVTRPWATMCGKIWTIGPFRPSTTPYLFTKLLKPLLAHWHALSMHIFIYLDGLALCDCWNEALWFLHIIHMDLHCSGFHEQELKCLWDPETSTPWLSIVIDLCERTAFKRINGFIIIQH